MMDRDEYSAIQTLLIGQAGVIEYLDLQGFIQMENQADSIGPIIDPTLYRKGHRRMAKIRALASAYTGVQKAYRELKELIIEEEARS